MMTDVSKKARGDHPLAAVATSYDRQRDRKVSLHAALGEAFADVRCVSGSGDAKVQSDGPQSLVPPSFLTTSSSPGALSWPSIEFNIIVTCRVSDSTRKPVTQFEVPGKGRAEFDEI